MHKRFGRYYIYAHYGRRKAPSGRRFIGCVRAEFGIRNVHALIGLRVSRNMEADIPLSICMAFPNYRTIELRLLK